MAGLVVGGVECTVEADRVTFGHVVIPLGDIVAFGVATDPGELVVAYERRAEESGYRETRGAVRTRPTMTLALHGDHDLLIAWLRQRVPERWRGYEETAKEVIEGRAPVAPARPVGWGRLALLLAIVLLLIVVGSGIAAYTLSQPTDVEPRPRGTSGVPELR